MVSGFNVTAATLNIQAFWADNGVIRMELSLGTVRNFYKFTGTPLVVLEGTSASAQVEYPTELYLPTLADILQSRHGGTNVWTSYDYPALSQTHPFPAFTDYGVIAGPGGNTPTRWCAPQITYGGGSFFIPINNPIGTPNVGFLELDTTLAYTKRFYGTTNVFNSAQAAWLASGSGFLLASRVGGALAPHILQHSGGASWSDLGVASPFTATKTLAGGSFFSGGSIYGLYFDNGGTNNVFLYSAASPFTTWAQVGSWSHAQASMDMGFMAWIL
jgi:hypothetical protein